MAWFWLQARARAQRRDDQFSLASAARPSDLRTLLDLAETRSAVVELGTGTAWTAIILALADPERVVISYDPSVRREREGYLNLVPERVRSRVKLRDQPDVTGPQQDDPPVEMLFIDSAHEREAVVAAFLAWRDALAPGAVVAFHDYDNPSWPGVREAVDELGLQGRRSGGMFIWTAPTSPGPGASTAPARAPDGEA